MRKRYINLGKCFLSIGVVLSAASVTACSQIQSKAIPASSVIITQPTDKSITVSQIVTAQKEWANGIVAIGKLYTSHGDYTKEASDLIDKLYAYNYEQGVVLFKPTKASDTQFRKTHDSALSYFVAGDKDHPEDTGFALMPWKNIKFNNDEIYIHGDIAIAMGQYVFTDSEGKKTDVEYTFGYVEDLQGHLKIIAHHSSLPYLTGIHAVK
jgi:hypothetical protein